MPISVITTNMPQSQKNKKNIAICHVQVPFIRGGAEVLVDQLKKEITDLGHNVDVIQMPFKWYPPERIIENAMMWRMADIDVSEALGKPIDMVICTKFPAYLVKHPHKVLWLFHQYRQAYDLHESRFAEFNTPEREKIRKLIIEMDNKFIPEAKKIFTISKNVTKRLKKYNQIESEVIYPGVKNPGKYFCKTAKDYVLFVSRLSAIKRPEILIKSIKHVKNKSLKFIFVGKDEAKYLEQLERIAKEEGVRDRIIFKTSYIPEEELLTLYAEALCIVFPPYDEDYGYITLEAFLSKKPIITVDNAGGPLEFVENGKNGFITADDDFKKIAHHIDYLNDNREEAEKMGEAGYSIVKNITWENALKKLIAELP